MPPRPPENPGPVRHRGLPRFIAERPGFTGGLLALILLGTLPVIDWVQFDKGHMQRVLTDMAVPLGGLWCALTVLTGAFLVKRLVAGRREQGGPLESDSRTERILDCLFRWSVPILWLVVTLIGNAELSARAIAAVELTDTPDWRAQPAFDAVVVLGGGIGNSSTGEPTLNRDGDRIRPALQMWYAGKVKQIIVTGTSAVPDAADPSVATSQLLRTFGVPDEAIVRLDGANTSAEMKSLRAWYDEKNATESPERSNRPYRIAIVTSAFHLPRALRLAQSEGLDLTPIPAASRQGEGSRGIARSIIPGAGALDDLSRCIKEWMARIVGR